MTNANVRALEQVCESLSESARAAATLGHIEPEMLDSLSHAEVLVDLADDLTRQVAALREIIAAMVRRPYAAPELIEIGKARINGRPVAHLELFEESGFWRWCIVDANGREYFDGGNYQRREDAARGLIDALDHQND
jgi:hypothetical protein